MTFVQYAVLGLAIGAVFALLAVGIVLVYRASGVLNFAHASMGTAAAYVDFELLERYPSLPVGVALVIAVAFGAVLGVVVHRVAFAPVARASQVVKLLVSFGVAGVIQGGVGLLWGPLGTPSAFGHSLLPLTDGVSIAGAVVPYQRLALVVLGVAASVGLSLLLARTAFGVQVRALAQNPLAARLSGIDDRRIERTTWAIAGASAALAAVLVVPFGAISPLALSGIQLKSLAAALVGGFVSAPAALAGGLGLGLAQELLVGAPSPVNGLRGVIATALVLVLLLVRVERFFVSEQEARALEGDDRLAVRGARVPLFGAPRWWLVAMAPVALLISGQSGFWAAVTSNTMIYALLGLSLVVLTGWSGQVSLMPGTFAGVGACLAWVLGTRLGFPLVLVLPLAALATIPVCAVVAIAALRLRPLYLAVATVALAGLFDETLFRQHWLANAGAAMTVTRPSLVRGDRAYALLVLVVAAMVFAATAALGRSRTGRALRMVRDNERAAAADGANPVKYRLLAFAVAAMQAGLAGALLAYALGTFSSAAFGFLVLSLAAFGMAIVGGIRSPLGAVVGAFGFVYLTEVFRSSGAVSDWTSVFVGFGIVAVLGGNPDGLVGLVQSLARRLRRDVDRDLDRDVGVVGVTASPIGAVE
ncbi:MAG TPA: ABC transporter permease [Acidimicrobiales bacterium]|jgi:sulfate-transporting ATPase|nr:ABC transporter permease [Acidimicrobiales bacterium]